MSRYTTCIYDNPFIYMYMDMDIVLWYNGIYV